ncbi:hypothetical protein GCM10008014_05490 [Paenibacillus silvae]|uniref:Uncharacterized protein n=1 Tax=Paenibacillus silvae TaxID=1325358 RepID=A0ABQ1Z1B4_9BACL|nr:hypothetical protein GCM10008014_05490 [Paenibacillus silvae]
MLSQPFLSKMVNKDEYSKIRTECKRYERQIFELVRFGHHAFGYTKGRGQANEP